MRKVFAFDLDGTLAISKGPIDQQMILTLQNLLSIGHNVCVISGGRWEQFQEQLIQHINPHYFLSEKLHCFPTCGTSYYRYHHPDWIPVYNLLLSTEEKNDILSAFDTAFAATNYLEQLAPAEIHGEIIEDRGSQITFSAAGQKAPHALKKSWDPTKVKRHKLMEVLKPLLPDYDVRLGGTTSIDVTKKGCDKRLAIQKIGKYLKCTTKDIVFFGDALEPGGNDHPVYLTGVECIPVVDHIDCVWKIQLYLRSLKNA